MEVDMGVNNCGVFDNCFNEGGMFSKSRGSMREDVVIPMYAWE